MVRRTVPGMRFDRRPWKGARWTILVSLRPPGQNRNRIHSSRLFSSSRIFRPAPMRSREAPEQFSVHKLKTIPILIVSVQKRRNRIPKPVFSRFN